MTLSEAREELKRLEMEEFAYGYAMGSLHYDGETGAPRDTYIPRGKALGILSGVGYQLATGERSERLLDALSEHMDELTSAERRTGVAVVVQRAHGIAVGELLQLQSLQFLSRL